MVNYKNLQVWKLAHEFTIDLLKFLKDNKLDNNYRLKDQLSGSVISINSNVCEGSTGSPAEFKRYLTIAINSARECEYQLLILKDLDYMDLATYTSLNNRLNIIIGMLVNYKKTLVTK